VPDQRKIAMKNMKKKVGVYQNRDTGEKASLGKSGIEKMTSGKALYMSSRNGFKAAHHFEAAEKINILFRKAKYVKTEPDFYNRKDVLWFKKYETKFKTRDGVRCKAYITIKETSQGGNVFYSVELRK
jgi:hypothetical protein